MFKVFCLTAEKELLQSELEEKLEMVSQNHHEYVDHMESEVAELQQEKEELQAEVLVRTFLSQASHDVYLFKGLNIYMF